MRQTGAFEVTTTSGEEVKAFVPHPLPPREPPLLCEGELEVRYQQAHQALMRLELAADMVPSLDWFIYAFVRKEAVLSSQIEGTQATLMDLLNFEAGEVAPQADVEEVCNYLDALMYARGQLADPSGLPLSMRLLGQTHAILLRGERGAHKQPGEIRKSQNWIGGHRPGQASYVPPPPHRLARVLSDFERYMHVEEDDALPALMRAGLLHVQFESIHPYLDGNGRLGRLLVTLLLEHHQLLTRPMLYLSLYFKRHRQEYYERLNAVRQLGDWEGWMMFFLEGVQTIAEEAVETTRALFVLVSSDRERVLRQERINVLAIQLFERLPSHPLVTLSWVVETFGTTKPTASRAIETLVSMKLLVESTGKQRDRMYVYEAYLDLLRAGTELDEV